LLASRYNGAAEASRGDWGCDAAPEGLTH